MLKQENPEQLQRSAELLEELKDLRGGSVLPFQRRMANDPALLKAFTESYHLCNSEDAAIPFKYRELILMALGCAAGVPTTIMTHGKLAAGAGATIEEIGEVLRLVLFYCGTSAVIPAAELFEELDISL